MSKLVISKIFSENKLFNGVSLLFLLNCLTLSTKPIENEKLIPISMPMYKLKYSGTNQAIADYIYRSASR